MNPQAAQQYLRTRVLTATPEQLQLMLYDGALRFGQQARVAIEAKNYALSYNLIMRIEGIITEMNGSLKRDVAPEICGKLSALYNYAYRKLIEANIHHKVEALDEAMQVLKYQRENVDPVVESVVASQSRRRAIGHSRTPSRHGSQHFHARLNW